MPIGGIPDHDRRLLPEGRLAGPMPWVIAIMVFLTMLAAGAGLGIAGASSRLGAELAGRATVQIVEPEPTSRAAQQRAAADWLRARPDVAAVRLVPEAESRALVAPWLGAAAGDGATGLDFPIPALVDVTLKEGGSVDTLRAGLVRVAPAARADSHADWIAPVRGLLRTLAWIALALVALLALATAATVVLAARGALDTHRGTIGIVHLLGGTDRQITRLFQRRIALDALFGGLIGAAGAVAVILLVGFQLSALEGAIVQAGSLPWYGWPLLAIIPFTAALLAALVARYTLMRNLGAML